MMLGKIEGRRRRGWQRIRRLDGITNSMNMSLSKLREMVKDEEARRAAVRGITKSRTGLSNWTQQQTHGSDNKESTCNAEDMGSIPWSGRSPGEGNGNPLQYSCLGNPMDRGAWRATVHGVAKESDMTWWLNKSKMETGSYVWTLKWTGAGFKVWIVGETVPCQIP